MCRQEPSDCPSPGVCKMGDKSACGFHFLWAQGLCLSLSPLSSLSRNRCLVSEGVHRRGADPDHVSSPSLGGACEARGERAALQPHGVCRVLLNLLPPVRTKEHVKGTPINGFRVAAPVWPLLAVYMLHDLDDSKPEREQTHGCLPV